MSGLRVIVGAVAILVGAPPGSAEACTCATTEFSAQAALEQYDAVFLGQAVRVNLVEHCSDMPDGRRACSDERDVTFRVWKSWRGVDVGFVTIRTGEGGGDCGFDFAVGRRYVVFASAGEGLLNVDICSPTVAEAGNGERSGELGAPAWTFRHRAGEETW